jgi:hypothetical protein
VRSMSVAIDAFVSVYSDAGIEESATDQSANCYCP